jgi:hypothetical protein
MHDATFFIVIPVMIAIRLFAGHFDRERIREHVERSGGKVLDITWNPFGRGWFGSRYERIYEVRYRGRHGRTVEATCKTSMFSGVYWTGDSAPADFDDRSDETRCLRCGSTIQPGNARCPKCGWSYKDR